jgi:hypothetical protein
MTELLANHLGGRWTLGSGSGTALFDPVLGNELVRVDAAGLDLAGGFAHARRVGGAGLRALTYGQRAERLGAIAKVLQANRDTYYEISTANSGTTKADSGVDIDGAIYTLGVYAKLGATLPDDALPAILLDWMATPPRWPRAAPSPASMCRCPRAGWRCSSTPSTSRAGACGKRPRPRCWPACRWWSSPPPPPPG